ncbi:MAG TPA: DeoR/GlpR family DNA-binding transcription regulator [Acidimicrobiales bacterium]|jgi:DeoR family fructose operon transcriptional repressor
MFAEERHQEIVRRARENGRVDVATLSEELDVTPETVRRDLTALERAGHLRRVHGGAIAIERFGFEPAVSARETVLTAEKARIGKAALAELPEDGAIVIDAGTTTRQFIELLPTEIELTVVVNSPPLATLLARRSNVTVMLLGGRVRGRTLAAVGDWATAALGTIHVDVAFMATNGVSVERGLTTPDPAEAAVKRAMMTAARRTVLLADHTKIGNDYFARFGDLPDVDTFITDTGADAELVDEISEAGPRVVLA